MESIGAQLNDVSKSFASHRRASNALKTLYQQDGQSFAVEFIKQMNRILTIGRREANIERVANFIISFCASEGDLALVVVAYLVEISNASDKAVRFRTSQLIGGIINNLQGDVEISEDLFALIGSCMAERARDRVPAVRCEAVKALTRFQGEEADDEVVALLIELATTDSSKEVRKAALTSLAVTKRTIPVVVGRSRDVKGEVRRSAFLVLAQKVPGRSLPIATRCDLVENGLADRAGPVCKAAHSLLKAWLDDDRLGRGSPAGLLAHLDVVAHEAAGTAAARALVREVAKRTSAEWAREFAEAVASGLGSGTPEQALLFKVWVEHLHSVKATRVLEELPSVTELCPAAAVALGRVKSRGDEDARKGAFVCARLIELMSLLDLSEEIGRRNLATLVTSALACPDEHAASLVVPALAALRRMHGPPAYAEVVAACEPAIAHMEGLGLRARALAIAAAVLEHAPGPLPALHEAHVAPVLASSRDPEEREAALRCDALATLLSREGPAAETVSRLRATTAAGEDPAVRATAARALFDLAMAHPQVAADEGALEALSALLDDANTDLREVAVAGLSKLLFTQRVASASILARLVLAFFSPTSADSPMVIQTLSVFFPAFAFSNPANTALLASIYLPVLRVLHNAPASSPLATISLAQVAQFLVFLTSPANGADPAGHASIAVASAMEVAAGAEHRVRGSLVKAVGRVMVSLDVPAGPDRVVVTRVLEGVAVEGDKPLTQSIAKWCSLLAEGVTITPDRERQVDDMLQDFEQARAGLVAQAEKDYKVTSLKAKQHSAGPAAKGKAKLAMVAAAKPKRNQVASDDESEDDDGLGDDDDDDDGDEDEDEEEKIVVKKPSSSRAKAAPEPKKKEKEKVDKPEKADKPEKVDKPEKADKEKAGEVEAGGSRSRRTASKPVAAPASAASTSSKPVSVPVDKEEVAPRSTKSKSVFGGAKASKALIEKN